MALLHQPKEHVAVKLLHAASSALLLQTQPFNARFPASAQLDPSGSVPDAVLLEASALLSDQS